LRSEFFRVVRPGGLVLLQLPAVRLSEDEITARHALPDQAFDAEFAILNPPSHVMAYADRHSTAAGTATGAAAFDVVAAFPQTACPRGTPTFEMHVVPRDEVQELVRKSGGVLLHAIDDNAAGERWISYTYICRRG
jgi:hypothetical protein